MLWFQNQKDNMWRKRNADDADIQDQLW